MGTRPSPSLVVRIRRFIVLGCVRCQDELLESRLRIRRRYPPQKRKAPPVAVDQEVARRKADVLAAPVPATPDREAHQLQAVELTANEVNLGVRQLPRRRGSNVGEDLDGRRHGLPPSGLRSARSRQWLGDRFSHGDRGPEAVPQPALQRIEAREYGIGWREE